MNPKEIETKRKCAIKIQSYIPVLDGGKQNECVLVVIIEDKKDSVIELTLLQAAQLMQELENAILEIVKK